MPKKKNQSWIVAPTSEGDKNIPMNRSARRSFKKQTGIRFPAQLKPFVKEKTT